MKDFFSKTAVITKKELFNAFISPAVYIGIIIFITASSITFFLQNHFFVPGQGRADLSRFYAFFPYICILCIPAFTMHLWSGEITDLVFSLPVPDLALVTGKWLSSLIICIYVQVILLLVPFTVHFFGAVDMGQVIAANIVVLLYFSTATALGEFLSLTAKNQITSALLTVLVLSLLNGAHVVPLLFKMPKIFENFFNGISFSYHFDAASKGIIAIRDILFYFALTVILLGMQLLFIEAKKEND